MKRLPFANDVRPIQPGRAMAFKAIEFRNKGYSHRDVAALLSIGLPRSRSISEADVARMIADVEAQQRAM